MGDFGFLSLKLLQLIIDQNMFSQQQNVHPFRDWRILNILTNQRPRKRQLTFRDRLMLYSLTFNSQGLPFVVGFTSENQSSIAGKYRFAICWHFLSFVSLNDGSNLTGLLLKKFCRFGFSLIFISTKPITTSTVFILSSFPKQNTDVFNRKILPQRCLLSFCLNYPKMTQRYIREF